MGSRHIIFVQAFKQEPNFFYHERLCEHVAIRFDAGNFYQARHPVFPVQGDRVTDAHRHLQHLASYYDSTTSDEENIFYEELENGLSDIVWHGIGIIPSDYANEDEAERELKFTQYLVIGANTPSGRKW